MVETEASREALRKELANLQRKFAEFEDDVRVREKDYANALEDSRRSERKLDDNRRNLEVCSLFSPFFLNDWNKAFFFSRLKFIWFD